MLTHDGIAEELFHFVRQHFKELITVDNRFPIKQAWDKCLACEEMLEEDWVILKQLDIPPEKQEMFIRALAKKYGPQFTDEPGFIKQIHRAFQFKREIDAHVLNFGYVNVDQLLAQSNDDFVNPIHAGLL